MPNDTYSVTAILGDPAYAHDQVDILIGGTSVLGGKLVSNAAGQWTSVTVTTTVTANTLSLQFLDRGGSDPNFVLNALQFRPISTVQGITFALTGTSNAGAGTGADGITVDTYTGTIAGASLAGRSINVSTTLGTIVGVDDGSGGLTHTDNNSLYTGAQAIVESNNTFKFTVRRPTLAGVAPTLSAAEVTGLATGSAAQTAYTVANVRQLDFLAGNSTIAAPNQVLGVRAADSFAVKGFGWTTAPQEFDRGASAGVSNTQQSFHYGNFSDNFQIQVAPNTTYTVRVYLGDSAYLHDNVQVTVGSAAPYVRTTAAGQFDLTTTTVTTDGTGKLVINFTDLGGSDPNWVVDGIDIAQGGVGNLPGAQPQLAADVLVGAAQPTLTQAQLSPVVAEAIRRLAASGLGTTQVAALQAAKFFIQTDLGLTTGALGLTALGSEVVTLDATGAGHGWFIDATPSDDAEFGRITAAGEFGATDPRAATRYDLLTVVMHELEHVLGVSDVSASESAHTLMTDTLAVGVRRLPAGTAPTITTTADSLGLASLAQALAGPAPELFRVAPATTAAFASSAEVTAVVNEDRRVLPQSNLEERSVRVSITATEVHHEHAASSLSRHREGRHPQEAPHRQGSGLGPLR